MSDHINSDHINRINLSSERCTLLDALTIGDIVQVSGGNVPKYIEDLFFRVVYIDADSIIFSCPYNDRACTKIYRGKEYGAYGVHDQVCFKHYF